MNITATELLEFHRHKYKNTDNNDPEIRRYILENESTIFKEILDNTETSTQDSDQEEAPLDPSDTVPSVDSVPTGIDIGQIELDTDTLLAWEQAQTEAIESDNSQFKEYLQLQQKHREQFKQEIKDKGFTLTNPNGSTSKNGTKKHQKPLNY